MHCCALHGNVDLLNISRRKERQLISKKSPLRRDVKVDGCFPCWLVLAFPPHGFIAAASGVKRDCEP